MNAIDDVPETRWSAEGDGAWLQIDLGPNRAVVSAVDIAWYSRLVQGRRERGELRHRRLDRRQHVVEVDGGESSGKTSDHSAKRVVGFAFLRRDSAC